jgi:hypothetical protein
MGDHLATWRWRRSQGASDGSALPHGRRVRLTARPIGWLRLGLAQVSDGPLRQGRQARRARLLLLSSRSSDPYCRRARDPVLRHRRAAAPSPAWPRGSPRPDGDARHSVHAPCDTARYSGTTDPCGGEVSQRGNDGAAARHGIVGPSDPGKGLRYPTPSPVSRAARQPGSPRGPGSAQPTARSSTSRPAA